MTSIKRLVRALNLDSNRRMSLFDNLKVGFLETDGSDTAEYNDFLLTIGFASDRGDRSSDAKRTFDDIDTDDDRILLVKDLNGTENAGEYGLVSGLTTALGKHVLITS